MAILLITVAVYFILPTYPNYDTYYALIWGRELINGESLSFMAYNAPTQHPLSILFGALVQFTGTVAAPKLMVLAAMISMVILVVAIYRMGQVLFNPLIGGIAALIVFTRFDIYYLAIRGFVDVPYMAAVLVAAAVEAARPRRHPVAVLLLLLAAGWMRPEGVILAGLYWLYASWNASWRQRIGYAALVAAIPAGWLLLDWWVTGDPLYSYNYTKGEAVQLNRYIPTDMLVKTVPHFIVSYLQAPIIALSLIGLVVGIVRFRRRIILPLAIVVIGVASFLITALSGLAAMDRYLTLPLIVMCLFAALALFGFVVPPRPKRWRIWAVFSAVAVFGGAVFTVFQLPEMMLIKRKIAFQHDIHRSFQQTVSDPKVKSALKRCGPLTTPAHTYLADARWYVNPDTSKVFARAEKTSKYGVAIYSFGKVAVDYYQDNVGVDPIKAGVPAAGYRPVQSSRSIYTIAYVHCPPGVKI